MIITAKQYWTKLLPVCIKLSNVIPREYYDLITYNKTLQKWINDEVINEFLADKNNIKYLLEEMFYAKRIRTNYISQSGCTNEIEDIIKQYYIVDYGTIDDEHVEVIRR